MPEANFLFPHFSFLIFNNNKNIDNSNSLKIILCSYRKRVQKLRNPSTTHHGIKIQLTKLKMPLPKYHCPNIHSCNLSFFLHWRYVWKQKQTWFYSFLAIFSFHIIICRWFEVFFPTDQFASFTNSFSTWQISPCGKIFLHGQCLWHPRQISGMQLSLPECYWPNMLFPQSTERQIKKLDIRPNQDEASIHSTWIY